MNKLDIVITMGGLGSRFRKMGFTIPKFMIEAKGKTLFDWSMISLEGFYKQADQFIFIAMKDPEFDVEAFIKEKCIQYQIQDPKVILLDYLTDGQATTALLAQKYWKPTNGLLVYNIDTYVEPNEMKYEQLKGDGFIPCFTAPGSHWSFVKVNEAGLAIEIKEKERISDHCTLGAYYFKSCQLFSKLYQEYYTSEENLVNGEKYIAPLYNYLLNQGGEIYISDIPASKIHVLGTPEELQSFLDAN